MFVVIGMWGADRCRRSIRRFLWGRDGDGDGLRSVVWRWFDWRKGKGGLMFGMYCNI